MTSRPLSIPAFLRHPASLVVAVFALSCIGDTAGPTIARPGRFQIVPSFAGSAPTGIVTVDRIRIVLVRPGQTQPSLDTTVQVAPGDTMVDLNLLVPTYTQADTFFASVDMYSPPPPAGGTLVFHGGPDIVVAVASQGGGAPPPAPVPVAMDYVGPGAGADSVVITSVPPRVIQGDTVQFVAVAYDNNVGVPGTPMGWSTPDPARLTVITPSNAGSGLVRGGAQRGVGRVVVTLQTGQQDTASVPVELLPAAIGASAGSGQSATVRALLAQPIIAQVKATDSIGVIGVWVKFQVTAGGGTLSADSALTDAIGKASINWTLGPTAGTQTVSATTPKLVGAQALFNATGLAGTAAGIGVSAGNGQTATVGSAVAVNPAVVVKDADNNPVQGATVTFAVVSGNGQITGATQTTNASGVATIGSWTLGTTSGPNTLGAIIGTPQPVSGTPVVEPAPAVEGVTFSATGAPGPATVLLVSGLANATVGVPASMTVTARDQYSNVATGYVGTVDFTSTDGLAVLPPNYTFTVGDAGVHVFNNAVTFGTGGTQTVTATDVVTSAVTGGETISVGGGTASTFAVTGPATVVAGVPQSFTVTAKDGAGITISNYTGTVSLTSNDPLAILPSPYTFVPGDNGVHVFTGVRLRMAGARNVTATDQVSPTITGSGNVTVNPSAIIGFIVTGVPETTSAGTPHDVTVAAVDSFANAVTGYTGTIHFTTTDTAATVPADYTFTPGDLGTHTFTGGLTFGTSGPQALLIQDVADENLGGGASITVNPTSAVRLEFAIQPSDVYQDATMSPDMVVYALDASDNLATGFSGVVTLELGAMPCGGDAGGDGPQATAVNGVAIFPDVVMDGIPICDGYTAIATAAGLASGTSNPFNVLAPAGVNAWIGAVSGNWTDGTKWTAGAPPTAGEIAVIEIGGTYTVTINSPVTVAGLELGGSSGTQTLSITSNTLTINGLGIIGVNGVLSQTGGQITGTGAIGIDGTYAWSAGEHLGSGSTSIEPGGTLDLVGSGAKYLQQRTIANNGTIRFPAGATGSLYLWNAPVIYNPGLIDFQNDADILHYSGTAGSISNLGTIRKSVGGAQSTIGANLTDGGAIEVLTGQLQFTLGGTSTGAFTISAGAQLDFGGGAARTLGAGSSVSGGGQFSSSGGTTTLQGSYDVARTVISGGQLNFNAALPDTARTLDMVFSNGTQAGTGVLAVTDSLIWTAGTMFQAGGVTYLRTGGTLVLDSGGPKYLQSRTLVNDGTMVFPASGTGSMFLWDGPVIDNRVGALLLFQSDAGLVLYSGAAASFNNAGTIRKNAGAALSLIDANLNGIGAIDVQAGQFQLRGNGSTTGTFAVSAGATLDFSTGTRTLNTGSSVAGAGVISNSGGNTTIIGTYDVARTVISGGMLSFAASLPDTSRTGDFEFNGGTQSGPGVLAVSDSMIWTGGTLFQAGGVTHIAPGATLVVDGPTTKYLQSRTLVNDGTMVFPATSAGGFNFWDAGQLTNNGLLDIQAAVDLPQYSGAVGTINNAGTLRKSAGTGLSHIGVTLNNTGAVEAQFNTLQLSGGGSSTGTFNVSASAVLDFSGAGTRTLAVGSSLTGAGDVFHTNGTTTVNGTYDVTGRTSISAGTFNFSATLPDTSFTRVLELGSGTQAGTGVLSVTDSMVWTAGNMNQAGGVTHIGPAAVALIDGPSAKYLQARTLTNAGTLIVLAPDNGDLNLWDAAIINNLASGVIDFQSAGDIPNYSGTISTINNAGIIRKTAGTTSTVGGHLNSIGTVEVLAGMLQFLQNGTSSGVFTIAAASQLDWGGSGTRTLDAASTVSGPGSFSTSGGVTTIQGGYVTGRTQISAGTLSFSTSVPDTSTTGVLEVFSGMQAGTGVLAVTDSMIWTQGTLFQAGGVTHIRAGAEAVVDGTGAKYLQGRTLVNEGTVRFPATGTGTLNLYDAATIENLATGAIIYDTDADIAHYSGVASTINNTGLIRKAGGAGSSVLGERLNHSGGTIEVLSGTLQLPGTGTAPASTMSAPIIVTNGSVNFSSNTFELSNGFNVSGAGHLDLTGGALTAVSGTDSLVFRHLAIYGGGIQGPGVFFVTDSLYWAGGEMRTAGGRTRIPVGATLYVDGASAKYLQARTLINHGTIRFPATTGTGSLNLWDAATIDNLATGQIIYDTDADIAYYSGARSTVNNLGLIRKAGGAATSTLGDRLNHTGGTIEVLSGTLQLPGMAAPPLSTMSAPIVVTSGSVNFSSNTFELSNGFNVSGAGHVDLTGGALTAMAATDSLVFRHLAFYNGGIQGPGVFFVTDSLYWAGGEMRTAGGRTRIPVGATLYVDGASAKYLQARTLINHGTIRFPATTGTGSLNLWDAATIDNLATGQIIYDTDADIVHYSGTTSTVNNLGLIRKAGGAATSTLGDRLNHTGGTIEVLSGVLQIPGTATPPLSTMSAPVTVTGGSVNFSSNTFNLSTGFVASGAGHVDLTGGALVAVTGTDSLVFRHLAFYNGGIDGPGVFYVSDSLYWAGGEMRTAGGRTRIGAAATLVVDGASAKYLQSRTLINHGVVRFPAPTATGSLNLWNSAVIDNLAGGLIDLQTGAGIPHYSGTVSTINNQGTLLKSGGTASTIGDNFNNTGTVAGTGTLDFTGTVTTPGIFAPGVLAGNTGILQVEAPLPLVSSSSVNIEIGGTVVGTDHDLLHVNGTAQLNGALNITFINGFVPTGGQRFPVLTYTNYSGAFSAINAGAATVHPDSSAGNVIDTLYLVVDAPAPVGGITWTNLGGGNWSVGSNWGGGLVPGPADSVFIPLSGTYTVTLDVDATVDHLALGGTTGIQTLLVPSGRTLTLNGADSIFANGSLDIAGAIAGSGSITNQGAVRLNNGTVGVPLANQALVIVSGASSSLSGALTTAAGSMLRIAQVDGSSGSAQLVVAGFTNNGLIELSNAFTVAYGATLTVPSGVLVNSPTGIISVLGGQTPGGARTLTAALDNQGSVNVAVPLTINGGSADHINSGTILVGTGDLTLTQGGTTPTFTNTGTGILTIVPGRSMTIDGGAFTLETDGVLDGGGALTLNSVTAAFDTTIALGSLVTTNSTLAFALDHSTAGGVYTFNSTTINGPGNLTNGAGETLTLRAVTVNAPLINEGELVATGISAVAGPFSSAPGSLIRIGQLDGASGSAQLTFANGFTNNGDIELTNIFTVAYGATLAVTSGTLTNAAGATISALGGQTPGGARALNAQLDNFGLVTVAVPLTITQASAAHNNRGTIDVTGGDLTITSGSSFTNVGSGPGNINVASGRTLSISNGSFTHGFGSTLAGAGTIAFTSVTAGFDDSPTIANLTATASNVSFASAISTANTTLAFAGTNVLGPGTVTNAAGETVTMIAGNMNANLVNEGTFIASGAVGINGTLSNAVTGTLRIAQVDGSAGAASVTVASGLTNDGAIELSNAFTTAYGAIFTVTSGTLVNSGTGTISALGGQTPGGIRTLTAQLDNQAGGVIAVSVPLTINPGSADHVNAGVLNVTGGDLTLTQTGTTPSFVNQGVVDIAGGRTFLVSGGDFTNSNSPIGTIQGTGTLNVAAAASSAFAGLFNPAGTGTGTLSITGDVTLQPSAVTHIDVEGTSAYDQLAINGNAGLDGQLELEFSAYTVPLVESYTPVTYASQSGAFATTTTPGLDATRLLDVVPGASNVVATVVALPAGVTAIWEGDVSSAWETAGNWSGGIVPGSTDNIFIRAIGPNDPIITNGTSIGDLTLQAGTGLSVNAQFTVTGNVAAGSSIFGEGTVTMSGDGRTVTGTMSNLTITGDVALSGPVLVQNLTIGDFSDQIANLDIGPHNATVQGQFNTQYAGTLTMQNAAGVLDVSGDITFGGGNTSTLLTNGNILARGPGFSQSGHDNPGTDSDTVETFSPSGAHVVQFVGTGPQTISFGTPTFGLEPCVGECATAQPYLGGSQFRHVVINNPSGATLFSKMIVGGNLAAPQGNVDATGQVLGVFLDANVAGDLTAAELQLGTTVAVGGTYNVVVTNFAGLGQTIPTSLAYQHIRVIGTGSTTGGAITTTGQLTVALGGELALGGTMNLGDALVRDQSSFNLNGHTLATTGSFSVQNEAEFHMTNAADVLNVGGAAYFTGESTEGQITAGQINLSGPFNGQFGFSSASFHASGTNQVVLLDAGAPTLVSMGDSSEFNDLEVQNPAGVALITSARVAGDWTTPGGGGGPNGPGATLTVGGDFTAPNISALELAIGGTITVSGSYDVANTNFTGTQAIPLAYTYQAITASGTVTLGAPLTVSGLTVAPGGQLDIGANNVTVQGNVDAQGSGVAGSGVIVMEIGGDLGGTVPNVQTDAFTALTGPTTINGALLITADEFRVNGQKLTITGNLVTVGTGSLGMRFAEDSVSAVNVNFQGASTSGQMDEGVLTVGGNFTQAAFVSDESFAASGNHKTRLLGTGTVTFATPGDVAGSSRFAALELANSAAATFTLGSDVYATGQFIRAATGNVATLTASPKRTLNVVGLDASEVTFNNVNLASIGGTLTQLNDMTFQGFGALDGDMLVIRANSGTLAIADISFTGTLNPFVMQVEDLDGGGDLVVNITGTITGLTSSLLNTIGGAIVNGL